MKTNTNWAFSQSYNYQTRYFNDVYELKNNILNKTIIPYQVEIQPGPESGRLCWLRCPYCYGLAVEDDHERLSLKRYYEILRQIAENGVKKIIYAGYATDPLNYEHIDKLLGVTIQYGQVFGFHTKALRVSNGLLNQLSNADITPQSYFSISVDAGNNDSYGMVHGISNKKSKHYDIVVKNINKISTIRHKYNLSFDIIATYLVNRINSSPEEITKAIHDLRNAGVDLIRFTFAQLPRGYKLTDNDPYILNQKDIDNYINRLTPIITNEDTNDCHIFILNQDKDYSIYRKERTLPCFARFIFPTISFNGWLCHCSESSSPYFKTMSLGDLKKNDFWKLYYDYNSSNIVDYLKYSAKKMSLYGCKCDRKEHVVNDIIKNCNVFDVPDIYT